MGRLAHRRGGQPRDGARRAVAGDQLARDDERRHARRRTLAAPGLLPVLPRRPAAPRAARRQPAADPPPHRVGRRGAGSGRGGGGDATTFDRLGVRDWAAGLPLIVVMPDGGFAGWYSDPVGSHTGPHDWESFHVGQLIPWVDATFRTHAGADGRAVSGFSMGGFGALKYAARHPGLFSSVSSHSGPADLRRDHGTVGHWADVSSATELGGATVYGVPLWDERRASADNPVEHVESYRGKRVFLVVGTNGDAVPWFSAVQEQYVRNGHRGFRSLLNAAGIPHMAYEEPGGHVLRHPRVRQDPAGITAHLRPAA
ncbi:alpha/beta hydrolase [Streptomyces sp. NPDC057235]|uniref:alpha/beta hydrolase n=1 Tax=Streptomyces sp. NPDC057235 TaxID=3346058 RepID=UPI00363DB83C